MPRARRRRPRRARSVPQRFTTIMHRGMEGHHLFRISIPTDHPTPPVVRFQLRDHFS